MAYWSMALPRYAARIVLLIVPPPPPTAAFIAGVSYFFCSWHLIRFPFSEIFERVERYQVISGSSAWLCLMITWATFAGLIELSTIPTASAMQWRNPHGFAKCGAAPVMTLKDS
jgi:hypothetical protein|tara:strand:- start:878 stop:1219 length:342 start_codon:yes stop_codon:yes gene_type:complete